MALRSIASRYKHILRANYSTVSSGKHTDLAGNPEIYLSKSILEGGVNTTELDINKFLNPIEKNLSTSFLEAFVKSKLGLFSQNLLNLIKCNNEKLSKATTHLISANSKLFRPIFALSLGEIIKHLSAPNHLYQENSEKVVQAFELVHIGSLIHDDILDDADKRRKIESTHKKFGTKLAVLAGDLLLSKAALIIANLQNPLLCVKTAKTLNNLIQGELMDIKSDNLATYFERYLEKNFLKTASLIAECCSSISIIANSPQWVVDLTYKIGLHIGMAFQFYDDYLDYKSTSSNLGKPTLNDLSQGIVTFPLFSLKPDKFNEAIELMESNEYTKILDIVREENTLEKTKLAVFLHLEKCFEILNKLASDENTKIISSVSALLHKTFTRLTN